LNVRKTVDSALLTALLAFAACGTEAGLCAGSSSIHVEILDRDGAAVPEVAVYAVPDRPLQAPGKPSAARMDQRDRAFVPHILIVETGTVIGFPNSDDVLHHVYSFSSAKRFELPLYGGVQVAPELTFDEPGLVTLGCNIHDDMLGYVLVVDTPYFAKTQGEGTVDIDGLPEGHYRIHVWTPRLRGDDLPEPVDVQIDPGSTASIAIRFEQKLRAPHAQSETALLWSRY
jgi:plastocyanin